MLTRRGFLFGLLTTAVYGRRREHMPDLKSPVVSKWFDSTCRPKPRYVTQVVLCVGDRPSYARIGVPKFGFVPRGAE